MRLRAGENQFYQLYFQEPGRGGVRGRRPQDPAHVPLLGFGRPATGEALAFPVRKVREASRQRALPETLPGWLTEPDIDFFTEEFERTGFRGGLNWYRNLDRMWELTPFLSSAKLRQPSLFIAGEVDAVLTMYREHFDALEETMPNLRNRSTIHEGVVCMHFRPRADRPDQPRLRPNSRSQADRPGIRPRESVPALTSTPRSVQRAPPPGSSGSAPRTRPAPRQSEAEIEIGQQVRDHFTNTLLAVDGQAEAIGPAQQRTPSPDAPWP